MVGWRWALALACCGGCAGRAPAALWAQLERRVVEPSGLAASAEAGVFWTHGDSGTEPLLFAVDARGAIVGAVRVDDAPNPRTRDWEDVALGPDGRVWIADSGNNTNERRDLAVFAVPGRPVRGERQATPDPLIRFRYPDQSDYPDPDRLDFDAEALFWADDRLFLLSKHRSDSETTLYRFPALAPPPPGELVLERISDFDVGGAGERFGGRVTGADLSPDGRTLAVLTYHALWLFDRPASGHDWLSRPLREIRLDQGVLKQCESIAWAGDDLLIGNEDGRVLRLRRARSYVGAFPPEPE